MSEVVKVGKVTKENFIEVCKEIGGNPLVGKGGVVCQTDSYGDIFYKEGDNGNRHITILRNIKRKDDDEDLFEVINITMDGNERLLPKYGGSGINIETKGGGFVSISKDNLSVKIEGD